MTHPLPDFALEVFLGHHEFTAKHHLTASDSETLSIGELLRMGTDEQRAAFDALGLGYTTTWGTEALRAAIASTYASEGLGPEHVLVFAGAQEAMFWSLQTLVEPGDHVVVTVPNYQSMESIPVAHGVEVSGLPLWEGEGASLRWTLDLQRLRSLLQPNTRLIAVNFPNNPTGFVPDHATWTQLVQLCEERGILIFSDEVYRGIEIDDDKRLVQAADLSASAISLNVMSKAYGLPGLRIGWLASRNRALLERIERRKHYTSICSAAPSELLATIALRNGEAIRSRNAAIVRTNYARLSALFGRCGGLVEWSAPDGGCVIFPRYTAADGVEAFAASLLAERSAIVLPSSIYRSQLIPVPADRFRIGLGRRDTATGWAELEAHLMARA